MKVLKLTIKRKWLNMLLSGEKLEDYREFNKYYESRLEGKWYDFVEFYIGGYFSETIPCARFKFLGYKIGIGNVLWGAPAKDLVYIIKVGELVEKNNI